LRRRRAFAAASRTTLAAALALAASAGCAHHGPPASGHQAARAANGSSRPEPDSITSALWHLDESVGAEVADAGPFRLGGVAGLDSRTDYGRIGRARTFTRSINSFVYVPYNPLLEAGRAFTIEAWIDPADLGLYEDTPIAARWTPEPLQTSWMLSLVGRSSTRTRATSPGDHRALVQLGAPGRLMFAFQPEDAGPPRAFFSSRPVQLDRWTHVAATYDGEVVRIYLDGVLDAQYASPGRVRDTTAPLLIGNYLDPRWLTSFGGALRVGSAVDPVPYYAFWGLIDEVRISSSARADFLYARGG